MIDLITKRIHIDGNASDGHQIGTYSKGYMAIRTGVFQNSDRFVKGAQTGQAKNAGVFTKRGITKFTQQDEETVTSKRGFVNIEFEKNKRPNFHRSNDPKVVISLTRQLENDYAVIATQKGYGIGFLNPHNFDKSQWVQLTYGKRIFDLSEREKNIALDEINDLVSKAIQ